MTNLLTPAARPILAKFSNIIRTNNPKLHSQSHDYLYIRVNDVMARKLDMI